MIQPAEGEQKEKIRYIEGKFACIGSQPITDVKDIYWQTGNLQVPTLSGGEDVPLPTGIWRAHNNAGCHSTTGHNIIFVPKINCVHQ